MNFLEKTGPVVAIAGATGFIGQALLKELINTCYRITGLTRSHIKKDENPDRSGITWRQCDLFSLIDAEKALEGADYAFYLVHSMMPSARLTQGTFQDMDLILADNFARAAKAAGVKQIIYLGGLVPRDSKLSQHLQSRLEVEETLGAHGVPVTALRAGLVVGRQGSSFSIIIRLVERFPFLIFPGWMMSPTHPIALSDTTKILLYCLENRDTFNRSFDIGGPDIMNYREMIQRTAAVMGYSLRVCTFPFGSTRFASIALSVMSSTPRALVTPLVESLKHSMVANNLCLQEKMGLPGISFEDAVKKAVSYEQKEQPIKPPRSSHKRIEDKIPNVRSVQRLPLPEGKDADWVARHYSVWLPKFFKTIVKVKVDRYGCYFYFRLSRRSLLDLTFSHDRSSKERPLYYITGGLLARLNMLPHHGRLEFREVLNDKYVLVAIHDYVPTIPWFLYHFTQAPLHLWVMYKYRSYLESLPSQKRD